MFFQKFANEILKSHLGEYIKIGFMNSDGNIEERIYKIESGMIKKIIDFYTKGRQDIPEDQIGSDEEM